MDQMCAHSYHVAFKIAEDSDKQRDCPFLSCTNISQGIRGFYKGITASYMGISETVVHFVLYEGVKARLIAARSQDGVPSDQRSPRDFLEFMGAGAFSKTVASCIAYPHGKDLL